MRPVSLDGAMARYASVMIYLLLHMTKKVVYKVNSIGIILLNSEMPRTLQTDIACWVLYPKE